MRSRGVLLYGPPASGKSTMTSALLELDPRFVRFEPCKVGGGVTQHYRISSPEHLNHLREAGELIWEIARYGNRYAFDRPGVLDALARGVPLIHLGQPEAISAFSQHLSDVDWLVVELHCNQAETTRRLHQRNPNDYQDRLDAWAQTPRLTDADLALDTSANTPAEAAHLLCELIDNLTSQ